MTSTDLGRAKRRSTSGWHRKLPLEREAQVLHLGLSGFRVQDLGSMVQGWGFGGWGFRAEDFVFSVSGSELGG